MKYLYDQVKADLNKNERYNFIRRTKGKKSFGEDVQQKYLSKMPEFDPLNAGDSLRELETLFRCKIYCWTTASARSKWECCRHSPYITDYDTVVDIIIEYDPVKISLMNVGLVLDVEETFSKSNRYKRKNWTILEATAMMKNPELQDTIEKLREEVAKLEQIWGKQSVHIADAKQFWTKFKLSLQVWSTTYDAFNHVGRFKVFDYPRFPNLIGMFQIIFLLLGICYYLNIYY